MKYRSVFSAGLISLSLVTFALAEQATLTKEQVIKLADAAAKADGFKLAEYNAPRVHYEFVRKDDTWAVFYDGTFPSPGNHFLVTIHDKTKKADVFRGQ